MEQMTLDLAGKKAEAAVHSFGPVNLVFARTDKGMIGCGLFDIAVFDRFNLPAAKMKAADGGLIRTVDDLLAATAREVNQSGQRAGIQPGMNGRAILEKL